MNNNEKLISTFYKAFQNRDYKTMQECYADDAIFCDEVFQDLDAEQVRAMWEMLIKQGKDLTLEFKNVHASETQGSAEWTATYTFSKTNRKVVNRVQADFIFENGKIAEHTDSFSFYKWAVQAFGITGALLGWTTIISSRVRKAAMQNLRAFMQESRT